MKGRLQPFPIDQPIGEVVGLDCPASSWWVYNHVDDGSGSSLRPWKDHKGGGQGRSPNTAAGQAIHSLWAIVDEGAGTGPAGTRAITTNTINTITTNTILPEATTVGRQRGSSTANSSTCRTNYGHAVVTSKQSA